MTLARRLRRGRFDIFHANPSRAEAAIARGLGIPVVCRRNVGFDGYWARWRQHGVVCRLLNAPVDRFIVPARFLVDEYARRGVARERVRLVHNGVSVRVPGRAEIKRARAEMGDGRAPLIVSAGRLVALKGHRLLIAAAARLKSQGAAFRVAIIGDGEERPSLEDLARASGVGERVRLLGWRAQVAPYLAAAAIYVQPSLSDVLPNTVLEAMALGRCVVASDVGGLRDAIEPGYSGALTPPGDAAALAHELGLLLANKAARACFGAAAQRTIARDFTVAEMVRRTEAVYRELIEVQR
jgi:glycosyltransferase involved in cell wall biosynthesis